MLDDTSIHSLFDKAPSTKEFKKLRKRVIKETRQAIEDFGMIEPGGKLSLIHI